MNKVFEKIFSIGNLKIFGLVFLLIFIASMWHRSVHIDENWFGEQGYWLVKDGVVKLKSMPGLLNFDQRMFVYHKFYVLITAAIIKLFGWSVYYLKFFTLLVYAFFFFIFYKYYRKNQELFDFKHYVLASLIILASPIMIIYGFTFRPDTLIMTLGFLSFYFLDQYIKSVAALNIAAPVDLQPKNLGNTYTLILAGVFAGLNFFTHLNGAIFCVTGTLYLFYFGQIRGMIIFSIACGITCLLYGFDLWQEGNWTEFMYQLKNYPVHKFNERFVGNGFLDLILKKIISIINEHYRYFWGPQVVMTSIIFWISFVVGFKHLRQNYKSLFTYSFILMLTLAILGSHKVQNYLIFLFPYMALISAIVVYDIAKKDMPVLKTIYLVCFILMLFFGALNFQKIFKTNNDFVALHQQVLGKIPEKEEKILVPWQFIFNEINNYKLVNYTTFKFLEDDMSRKMSQKEFFVKTAGQDIKYMVIDQELIETYTWFATGKIESNGLYKEIYRDKDYIIVQRK